MRYFYLDKKIGRIVLVESWAEVKNKLKAIKKAHPTAKVDEFEIYKVGDKVSDSRYRVLLD